MKNESELSDPLSRRSLLGRAVGAAGIMAALGSTGQADAQMQPADDSGGVRREGQLRLRLEVLQGECARCAAADFRGRERKPTILLQRVQISNVQPGGYPRGGRRFFYRADATTRCSLTLEGRGYAERTERHSRCGCPLMDDVAGRMPEKCTGPSPAPAAPAVQAPSAITSPKPLPPAVQELTVEPTAFCADRAPICDGTCKAR